MRPPAQRAIQPQRVDRGEVVGLLADAVVVEPLDRRVGHRGRDELRDAAARRIDDARRLELEPGLGRGDLAGLRRARPVELDQRLPASPRELVVVPHADERPARPRVLQVGILEIGAEQRAVVIERDRDVEVADLLAGREPHDVAQPARVHALRAVLGVPHDLVEEVAEVEHEAEPIGLGALLVLEDHPAVGGLRALADVLAADERELDRPRIAGRRRGDRPADPAAVAAIVDEAVPVDARRGQAGGEHAHRPVARRRQLGRPPRDHALEPGVLGDLDRHAARDVARRPAAGGSTPARCARRGRPTRRPAESTPAGGSSRAMRGRAQPSASDAPSAPASSRNWRRFGSAMIGDRTAARRTTAVPVRANAR